MTIFPLWTVWVVVAVLFLILEIFTTGFAVFCFSVGALAGAIGDACGLSLTWQVALFAVFSAVAFVTIRPLVLRFFHKKGQTLKTNGDALVGRKAEVTEAILPGQGGLAKIDGSEWKAVCPEATEAIPAGTMVEIVAVDSIILTVKK